VLKLVGSIVGESDRLCGLISLVVYYVILKMTNKIIEKELVEGREVKEAERFLIGLSFV
jgi:hypothetical protein